MRRRDDGQAALLLVGFFLLAVLLVGVVVDASAAYLRRQALDNLADGAALAGADAVGSRHVYAHGLGVRAQIDAAVAREQAAAYLHATGAAARYPGLTWNVHTDTERVVVRVAAPLDLPIPVPGVGATARVSASGAAFVAVGR